MLVIDDDPSYLALATQVLKGLGAEPVTTAADARTAIEVANDVRPDAALVDVWLPDRSGIDLAYELAALPWRPRVILMSTDTDAASAIKARGENALPFIPKERLAGATLRRLLTS